MRRLCLPVLAFCLGCGADSGFLGGPQLECRPYAEPEGADADQDGLLDRWEDTRPEFDASIADSDSDGIPDGLEDEDRDGLTVRQEFLASELASFPESVAPQLDRSTLLVEVDVMDDFGVDQRSLQIARDSFDATSVDLRFFADECEIPSESFEGSFEERQGFLAAHPADAVPAELADSLVHVVFAARRLDAPGRPGEAIADRSDDPERTGLLIYFEPLIAAHPRCATGALEPIQLHEAVGGTLVHELGHALQLGHDTELGGGINFYNIMAQTSSCFEVQQRHRGAGNRNPSLGSTEAVGRPRFSSAASALMLFQSRLSVDTAQLLGGTGREM